MTLNEEIIILQKMKPTPCRADGKSTTHILQTIALEMAIKALEQTRWIPVSERLPEDGTYLVTVERITGLPHVKIDSFAKDLYKVDEFDFCDKKGKCGWYNYDSEYGYLEDDKVIAWMPLPKPYEPQESETSRHSNRIAINT